MDIPLLLDMAMRGSFFFLLCIFTIYTLFLGYHWFTYGTDKKISMAALLMYLGGGALLFLSMGTILAVS